MSVWQTSLDDLGTPLSDVTFCVIDFETTGSSPTDCLITEIGAVKLRGGECCGTLQTLINPGSAIPPTITVLTGITEAMVSQAPRIESVLGTLVDFIADSVIVAHNARFDMGFLQAALLRDHRPELTNVVIDTVALSRRLLRDEVPNCKLGTLARHYRFAHQPSHRALDDALATGDLLHIILDRARSLGVTGLDDLRSLPKMANHAQASKLSLTDRLPRSPGVYLFRDPTGRVLYVGKATNLRSRVRSYFSTDDRRKIGPMLRETARIDFKRTDTALEAAVLEVRLIHHLEPHYNREANRWNRSVYVMLTDEPYPRLKIVKHADVPTASYIGPLSSKAGAQLVVDALHSVIPLRRCNAAKPSNRGPCVPAQLGVALCRCSRDVSVEEYAPIAALARRCFQDEPALVIDALCDRMNDLAAQERFEEAAATRDRMSAFSDAIKRQRLLNRIRSTERLQIQDRVGNRFEFQRGQLVEFWPPAPATLGLGRAIEARPQDPGPVSSGPLERELADELLLIGRWLDRNFDDVRLLHVGGQLCSSALPVPVPGRAPGRPG